MRIVSSYKDYYDYLQGIYGQDEKVVLVRQTEDSGVKKGYNVRNELPREGDHYEFHIMGRIFNIYYYQDRFISDFDLFNMKKRFKYTDRQMYYNSHIKNNILEDIKDSKYEHPPKILATDLNDKHDCPIILKGKGFSQDIIKYPELKQFNFAKFVSAEDMWINLYNWLSREKEQPTPPTDKEKIVSHGFDLKTSFRNM